MAETYCTIRISGKGNAPALADFRVRQRDGTPNRIALNPKEAGGSDSGGQCALGPDS